MSETGTRLCGFTAHSVVGNTDWCTSSTERVQRVTRR